MVVDWIAESDADRLAMLDDEATYNAATIKGVFEAAFLESDGGLQGIETSAPTFLTRDDDVSGVAHGGSITIDSISYTIQGIQPDGSGMTLLILEEV